MRRLDTYVCAVNQNSLVPFHPADPEYKAQKLETVSESESEDEEPPKLALARRRAIAAQAVTPFGVLSYMQTARTNLQAAETCA